MHLGRQNLANARQELPCDSAQRLLGLDGKGSIVEPSASAACEAGARTMGRSRSAKRTGTLKYRHSRPVARTDKIGNGPKP